MQMTNRTAAVEAELMGRLAAAAEREQSLQAALEKARSQAEASTAVARGSGAQPSKDSMKVNQGELAVEEAKEARDQALTTRRTAEVKLLQTRPDQTRPDSLYPSPHSAPHPSPVQSNPAQPT